MMKLLFIPTGNVFVLPDEDALRIMATDRGNYKIVEGGLQKETTEQLPPETVKELVMQQPQEDEPEAEEEPLDYTTLNKPELMAYANRLGISCNRNHSKDAILGLIKEKIGR